MVTMYNLIGTRNIPRQKDLIRLNLPDFVGVMLFLFSLMNNKDCLGPVPSEQGRPLS